MSYASAENATAEADMSVIRINDLKTVIDKLLDDLEAAGVEAVTINHTNYWKVFL